VCSCVCVRTSQYASKEEGADKQLQQRVLVLAVGIVAVQVLQVGVETVLKVGIPTKQTLTKQLHQQ
jgi:hypothetical protein